MRKPSELTLRTAEPRDIEAVANLAVASFGEDSYRPFGFRQWMDVSPGGLIVAEHGSALVGYTLAAAVRGGETAWILTLCVRAEDRKRGIARALMQEAIERVKSWGAKTLLLTVAPENSGAARLFGSCGFAEVEMCEDYFGPRQTRMEMALALGSPDG